tara:strand:+ start:456 stop:746 length:291 start_codon:yes stop_codon:yes gene_type:complete
MVSYMGESISGKRRYELTLDKQVLVYPVKLPIESFGTCNVWFNTKKTTHSAKEMELANGMCMDCWDKGLGGDETQRQRGQRKHLNKKKMKIKTNEL